MSFVIRRAVADDAEALSRIACRTFTDTFGHMYPAEDLQDFLQANYSIAECKRLLAEDGYAVWLVEDGIEAIGHALAGPCGLPHVDVKPGDGELKRLYLMPQAQNGGLGSRLFETALAWLERDGARTIWISVWSRNLGAQRFYARWGFAKVAE
ncbi:MAG TPA: GNAT family N-acetyltransferase, partial [Xanthomonadaceae bacterium]|nr:GNAT family N-acetyltransferase [Xanthomonadaceae bacterium]